MADTGVILEQARDRSFELDTRVKALIWTLASVALALGAWALLVVVLKPAPYILPAPWDVLMRTWSERSLLASHGLVTMGEIIAGLVISIVVAIPLGIAIVAIPVAEKLLYPIIVAFNAIPKVALAPLFVVWFGYGFLPRVLITSSIAFFPILVSTISGLIAIEPDLLRLARVLRAHRLQIFLRMRLPHALPSIFAGIKVATSLAVIGGIIGEFVASDSGWGYLLVQASGTLDTTIMFSVVIILAIVASLLFSVVGWLERMMVSWHASQRG
ncbi:ABC transporter permease [Roseiarcaceae bacterium H3SJ34-1]|uniref:ABC transporter permease n=1 Tax=Terripilifer ovatus TaxID=3032367 RepID=UPI003AB9A83F|nr:ABC transporter permease [Roseiarcaceae bacterium H3SJ34-1]